MSALALPPEIDRRVLRDEPLAPHTAWRVGGPADLFFQPADVDEIVLFLRGLETSTPVLWLGQGHHVLVRDAGVRGAVVALHDTLDAIERTADDEVRCGAGATCRQLAEQCLAWGLGPAAFFAGIPGTLGAALARNEGALGGEPWRHVRSLSTIDRSGALHERPASDYTIGYRYVDGPLDEGFLGARLRFEQRPALLDVDALRRLATAAPAAPIGGWSCGPLFTDVPGHPAASLIASAGLTGHRLGGARVSDEQANTIVNDGTAPAGEVERLLEAVRSHVVRVHGVTLRADVCIVGEAERSEPQPVSASASPEGRGDQATEVGRHRRRRRHRPVEKAPGPPGDVRTEDFLAERNITPYCPPGALAAAGPGRGAFLCSRQLGCPANLALATQLYNYLKANGWVLRDADDAECLIVDACVILVEYRQDVKAAVQFLARRYPLKTIFVTGCFVPEDRLDAPNVTYIGMLQKDAFDQWFRPAVPLRSVSAVSTDEDDADVQTMAPSRELYEKPYNVLVSTGCVHRCAYCIEPNLFPSVHSVPLDEIAAACKDGIRKGYKNFLIGAADISSYGRDLGCDVTDLFAALFSVFRGRPDLGVGFKALEPAGFLRHFDALKPYFATCRIDWIYLPLESGSDRVVRAMNRRYRVDDVLRVVAEIRQVAPALRIETDFVACYPTETTEDFETSLRLLEHFDHRNVVVFERHENTRAFALADEFSPDERARRVGVAASLAATESECCRFYFPLESLDDPDGSAPPASEPAPAEPRPEDGFFRVRLANAARAESVFDFTIAAHRLGAHYCRSEGALFLEVERDEPARDAIPLIRVLLAAMKHLADAPPSALTLPRWRAVVEHLLARTEPGRQVRCTLSHHPFGGAPANVQGDLRP